MKAFQSFISNNKFYIKITASCAEVLVSILYKQQQAKTELKKVKTELFQSFISNNKDGWESVKYPEDYEFQSFISNNKNVFCIIVAVPITFQSFISNNKGYLIQ